MVFRLGYDGHGLSSRTASCVLPLFVTTLLLVPAAASVTTFLFLWELMAITSLLLVLVDHRRRPEVQVAGQWYAVMTQFGAAALLVGLVLLATHAGSQSFAAIAAAVGRTCRPGCATPPSCWCWSASGRRPAWCRCTCGCPAPIPRLRVRCRP